MISSNPLKLWLIDDFKATANFGADQRHIGTKGDKDFG